MWLPPLSCLHLSLPDLTSIGVFLSLGAYEGSKGVIIILDVFFFFLIVKSFTGLI